MKAAAITVSLSKCMQIKIHNAKLLQSDPSVFTSPKEAVRKAALAQ